MVIFTFFQIQFMRRKFESRYRIMRKHRRTCFQATGTEAVEWLSADVRCSADWRPTHDPDERQRRLHGVCTTAAQPARRTPEPGLFSVFFGFAGLLAYHSAGTLVAGVVNATSTEWSSALLHPQQHYVTASGDSHFGQGGAAAWADHWRRNTTQSSTV